MGNRLSILVGSGFVVIEAAVVRVEKVGICIILGVPKVWPADAGIFQPKRIELVHLSFKILFDRRILGIHVRHLLPAVLEDALLFRIGGGLHKSL